MSKLTEYGKKVLPFSFEFEQERSPLQKGQVVIFEGEEAEVVRIKPLFVIKTKNRVVCGALQELFQVA